jgi:hypothetical protein
MPRKSILFPALLLASSSVFADVRVAPFRVGATDLNETVVGVIPRGDGFAAITRRAAATPDGLTTLRYTPISPSGTPLAASARRLVAAPNIDAAAVSESGGQTTLLWDERTTIFAASVSSSGELGERHVIGKTSFSQPLDIGCNATRCLATWIDTSNPTWVRDAAMTDRTGAPVVRVPVPADISVADIVADPSGFLILGWGFQASQLTGRAVRIDMNGATRFDVPLPSPYDLAADFDGTSYAVVWSDLASETTLRQQHAAKLALDGTVSPSVAIGIPSELGAAIAWNGSEHVVAFSHEESETPVAIPESGIPSTLFVERLDAALAPIGLPVRIAADGLSNLVRGIAWNGKAHYVGWDRLHVGDASFGVPAQARGVLVGTHADPGVQASIAVGPMSQRSPALASSRGVHLAAWIETDHETQISTLFAARIGRGGNRIDSVPITVATGRRLALANNHAIAAIEGDFLITWAQSDERVPPLNLAARAAIIRSGLSGVELVTLSTQLATPSTPRVASNGSSWLVASGSPLLAAQRVTRSGFAAGAAVVVGRVSQFDVASDGDRFAILRSYFECEDPAGCPHFRFTSFNGDGGVRVAEVPVAPVLLNPFALAGDARGYTFFGTSLNTRPVVMNFDRDAVRTSPPLEFGTGFVDSPAIAPLGDGWVLRWNAAFTDEMTARVNRDATAVDQQPETMPLLGAIAGDEEHRAVAMIGREEEEPPYGAGLAQLLRDFSPGVIPPRRRATR